MRYYTSLNILHYRAPARARGALKHWGIDVPPLTSYLSFQGKECLRRANNPTYKKSLLTKLLKKSHTPIALTVLEVYMKNC